MKDNIFSVKFSNSTSKGKKMMAVFYDKNKKKKKTKQLLILKKNLIYKTVPTTGVDDARALGSMPDADVTTVVASGFGTTGLSVSSL
mgnify:CR=1 FL=1